MKGEISSAHLILSAKHLRGGVFYLDKSENGEVESKVLFSHFRCVLSMKTKDGLYSPSPGFSPDIDTHLYQAPTLSSEGAYDCGHEKQRRDSGSCVSCLKKTGW